LTDKVPPVLLLLSEYPSVVWRPKGMLGRSKPLGWLVGCSER